MTPVDASIPTPAGSAGVTVYETTVPVTVGDNADMGTSTVNVVEGAYERPAGAVGTTAIDRPKVVEPPLLDALMV
jgi:hypothetical protein